MRLLSLTLSLLMAATPAAAQTDQLLDDLLETSPLLSAAKSEADAARAEVWEARGARLPQLRLEAQASRLDETLRINGVPGEFTATREPNAVSAVVDQAIFTSGRIGGAVGAARASANAAGHDYDAARQDVLLMGAMAISDVVRDRAVLRVRQENENVVRGRLDESTARRRAGLATDTDVRQSEARLALAEAERIFAQGALERSGAAFVRVFGFAAPENLTLPQAPTAMPTDLEIAINTALSANPDLASSADQSTAAKRAVRAERGALMPQVSLTASASRIDNERFGIELGEAEQYALTLNGRWDIFRGGSGHARTRAARRRADAAADIHRLTERQVREAVIASWADLMTTRSSVRARHAQVDAAIIAARGVAAEYRTGRRTRLDVLDADREQSDAEAALVAAQRDLAVAEFAMLRVMGSL